MAPSILKHRRQDGGQTPCRWFSCEIDKATREEGSRNMKASVSDLAVICCDGSRTWLHDVRMWRMKVPVDILALGAIVQYAARAAGLGEDSLLSQWKRFISPHVADRYVLAFSVGCSGSSGSECTYTDRTPGQFSRQSIFVSKRN